MTRATTLPQSDQAALRIEGLCKRYNGRPIVQDLSFFLRRGECYGLLGPNGAGKTTTLRTLLGLTPFDRGRVELLGLPVPAQARQARMGVGVVPQMDNLDPDFTVAEKLLVFGRYFGLGDAQIRERIPALLEFAARVRRDTRDLGPRDMIDAQSFIWVQGSDEY